jgi:transposase
LGARIDRVGHEVKLMPPAHVKACVKRNKNDAADAPAIREAATRPSMRFVPVKDVNQQAVLMMHRARNLLVRQRMMAVNALRAHLAESGVVAPQGLRHIEGLIAAIEENKAGLPGLARSILRLIVAQLDGTQAKARQIEARLARWHRNSRLSQLLATVLGVGFMGASAIAATASDPSLFRSGREFAAWLGMTPRQNSSGGKERWGEPANEVANAFAPSSWRGPSPFCGMHASGRPRPGNGCAPCWRKSRPSSWRSRLPTERLASSRR